MVALRNAEEADEVRGLENAGLTKYDPAQETNPFSGDKKVNKPASQALLKQHLADSEQQPGDPMPKRPAADPEGNAERGRYLNAIANPAKGLKLPGVFLFFKKHRKGSIAGVAIGVGMGGALFGFSALQPLKVVSIVNQLTGFYGAPGSIISRESDKLVSRYFSRYVLPGLAGARPRCHTTASPGCVGNIVGKGPVARLFQSWKQAQIETSLAKRGVVFMREGNSVYMYVNGERALGDDVIKAVINGKADLFKFIGKADRPSTIIAMRDAIRGAYYEDDFLSVFKRFIVGRTAVNKYAAIRCIFACKLYNPIKVTATQASNYAKNWIADQLINQYGGRMGTMMACLLVGTGECSTKIDKLKSSTPEPGDTLTPVPPEGPVSPYEASMIGEAAAETAASAAADIGAAEAGKEAAEKAISANRGFITAILAEALAKVMPEALADTVVNALPIIGTVISVTLIVAGLMVVADNGNPGLLHMTFYNNAMTAVKLFFAYSTVASETESGHMQADVLGSWTDTLTTNATGSPDDQADATSTPLYAAMFGGNPPTSSYKCNDGSSVPAGQLICPEEKLAQGNNILDAAHNVVNIFPPLLALAHLINSVNELMGHIGSGAFELACHIQDAVPPGNSCTNAVKAIGPLFGKFAEWFMSHLVASPFSSNMSGGRTFDMMAAGEDVLTNKTCQLQMGCAKITDQQASDLRAEAMEEAKASFAQRPIFARLFSTDTPYSLVSQLALALPSTPSQASVEFMGVISNPLKAIGSMLATMFSGSKIFAASQAFPDPFGVIQYGYTEDQIPDDPETYWDQHCANRDFAVEWENNQTEDDITGEPVATTPEPCMLIQASVSSAGGKLDTSLLPQDMLNADPTQ